MGLWEDEVAMLINAIGKREPGIADENVIYYHYRAHAPSYTVTANSLSIIANSLFTLSLLIPRRLYRLRLRPIREFGLLYARYAQKRQTRQNDLADEHDV